MSFVYRRPTDVRKPAKLNPQLFQVAGDTTGALSSSGVSVVSWNSGSVLSSSGAGDALWNSGAVLSSSGIGTASWNSGFILAAAGTSNVEWNAGHILNSSGVGTASWVSPAGEGVLSSSGSGSLNFISGSTFSSEGVGQLSFQSGSGFNSSGTSNVSFTGLQSAQGSLSSAGNTTVTFRHGSILETSGSGSLSFISSNVPPVVEGPPWAESGGIWAQGRKKKKRKEIPEEYLVDKSDVEEVVKELLGNKELKLDKEEKKLIKAVAKELIEEESVVDVKRKLESAILLSRIEKKIAKDSEDDEEELMIYLLGLI